ncbi:unnamed protein product [Cylindrotheca closterium]|uniref:Phosphodiesterase n=1 Tax=Cylindrotheca closterium TaxID=2856 RepID=A0AAD2JM29_9STRA|nr:unnamed protein product [Cylindrotheca closterium]
MGSHDTDDLSVDSFQSHGERSKASTTIGSSSGGDAMEHVKLLRKDSWIQSLRFLSLCILLVVGYVVAMTVYVSLKASEYREFENQFEAQSEQIGEGLQAELQIKLQAMEALSVAVTAYAESQSGLTWPNVTLPQFSYRSESTLTIGGGIFVGLQPLVRREQQEAWEQYSVQNRGWKEESIAFQQKHKAQNDTLIDESLYPKNISERIFHVIDGVPTAIEEDLMLPVWQYSPIHPGSPYVNYDQYGKERNRGALNEVVEKRAAVLGMFFELSQSSNGHDVTTDSGEEHIEGVTESSPAVDIWYPVFSDTTDDRSEVAVLSMTTRWDSFLLPRLPANPIGLIVVLSNECGQVCTFDITGDEVTYLGNLDSHEEEYEYYEKDFYFMDMEEESKVSDVSLSPFCKYKLTVYPSTKMRDTYATNDPNNFTIAVASIFIFTIMVFVAYDNLIERRQTFLATAAQKSNAIVSALFPKIVQDRLFQIDGGAGSGKAAANNAMKTSNDSAAGNSSAPPIADLFPNTTVMFGDIAGFTAWSSSRQPSQVFILLETLYGSFDKIARELNVFKVETIGDCYVAVTGLPNPQEDHHLRMVKFARRALEKMMVLTRELEVTLGPDTTNLGFRIGLNSGPVTAGVLRGERSRFQLFGDTVNTAARLESTGKTNQIQVSQATANLINASGKSHWIRKREEMVEARGKGQMQTYWVKHKASSAERSDSFTGSRSVDSSERIQVGSKTAGVRKTLIEWQIELLSRLLKQIIYHRKTKSGSKSENFASNVYGKGLPRDEIAEKISMPAFAPNSSKRDIDIDSIELSAEVVLQLEDLATSIAQLYHDNSFHNYEHACHVTMSANKLLQRIVVPKFQASTEFSKRAHDYTYGLTSDPLTQFAIIFSAIVHDIDHHGVSNQQLAKERNRLAVMYDDKSVAEQNSIDLAFEMLASPCYSDLVSCICADEMEYKRLRQLIVNCVMATDIFDKELKEFRNNRWAKAFDDNTESASDLKATIVIEHIIQAADVAHTMQHWHVYQKWNERLFAEMCKSHEAGRGPEKDPASGWYEGELWFFDNYVIPLARKLDECGVFGVSSDECLNYALENRREWESKGRSIVLEMSSRYSMTISEGDDC